MSDPRPRVRSRAVIAAGSLAVTTSTLGALLVGAARIPVGDALAALRDALSGGAAPSVAYSVVLMIRLPRALAALLIGAALSSSGAALQGLFRNPLVDPALIGVSAGAALSVALFIVCGSRSLGPLLGAVALPASAFAGALGATMLVWRLGSRRGRTEIATVLLAGIAINALAFAGIGLLQSVADDTQLRNLTFWTLGSLDGITWRQLGITAALITPAVLSMLPSARGLDALALGEAEARYLGVRVEQLKRRLVFAAAIAVGASVAVSGMIGFVGLVIPHLVRMALGPLHRTLLLGAIVAGAFLLSTADVLARTVAAPAAIPIGVVTAFVGAPYFIWLLRRSRPQGVF